MEGIGQKKETDYIFDKTIKCDVCGKEFKTKQVRTGKARFIGTDDILKPLYEGIDTCKYDIIMCPHCGYAASLRLFGHHTEKQRQAVRDNVSSRFTAKEPETETVPAPYPEPQVTTITGCFPHKLSPTSGLLLP